MKDILLTKYQKSFDLCGFASLKSERTGEVPDVVEFVLTKLDEANLLAFFSEIGFNYEYVQSVKPEYGQVIEEVKNEYGLLVPIPEKLAVRLVKGDTINEWLLNDYCIDDCFRIGKKTDPLFYEECISADVQDNWRAFMLASFGESYAKKLQTELMFEAYIGAAHDKKRGKSNFGKKLKSYSNEEFGRINSLMQRFKKENEHTQYTHTN